MNNSPFFEQTGLMVKILPLAMSEDCFALKGGTAINFFHREMPRLSVDIDLTYLPIQDRETTLNEISKALNRIAEKIKTQYPSYKVSKKVLKDKNPYVFKLQVHSGKTQIKIEPNLVLRGFCYETQRLSMCKTACNFFEEEVRCMVMSPEDLYGGKICAALDRQHPRDFYDVKILLENEGITENIIESFVVYLSSNNRPISELLSPQMINTEAVFQREFTGMAQIPVTYDDLMEARTSLIRTINKVLTNDHRQFLFSVKEGSPNFKLINIKGIEKLPALQWKIKNIQKMNTKKHKKAVEKLKHILAL